MPVALSRPEAGEFAPALAGYIAHIAEEEDLFEVLTSQLQELPRLLGSVPSSREEHRYAPGKWSIREIVGHLSDSERVFAYRALRFARGDESPLQGFDENAYVPELKAESRRLADLTAEWTDVRRATLSLFRHLPAEAWQRGGVASGKPVSVRALGFIIAGHTRHHVGVLEERYLGGS